MHKLFELHIWQNWLKFYNEIEVSSQMKIICNVKYCYAIPLKFRDKFLISRMKLVLKVEANICSTIKETLLHLLFLWQGLYHEQIPLVIETINLTIESLDLQNRHLNGAYIEDIIKNKNLPTNHPIYIYINRINTRLVFKIKSEYKLELKMPKPWNCFVACKN